VHHRSNVVRDSACCAQETVLMEHDQPVSNGPRRRRARRANGTGRALAKLPPSQRRVIVLRYGLGPAAMSGCTWAERGRRDRFLSRGQRLGPDAGGGFGLGHTDILDTPEVTCLRYRALLREEADPRSSAPPRDLAPARRGPLAVSGGSTSPPRSGAGLSTTAVCAPQHERIPAFGACGGTS
jgi:hypothetical protein